MTRERIKEIQEVIVPYFVRQLKKINYEGLGEADSEEAEKDLNEVFSMAIKALEQEPRKGRWIKTGDYYTGAYGSIEYVECSCCREDSLEEGDFCPNCGADMRGEE